MIATANQYTEQINTGKLVTKDLLSKASYIIPYFQRHYQWDETHIENLLSDIEYAAKFGAVNQNYFLGAFVLQEVRNETAEKIFQVIDGQQRLITLLLTIAVMRDLTTSEQDKSQSKQLFYPTSEKHPDGAPRIYFENREVANLLIKQLALSDSTKDEGYLSVISELEQNPSFANMANAVLVIHRYLKARNLLDLNLLSYFLLNKVFVIYIATDNFTDAFRLFSVLNDRGLPLSATDVIKSRILSEIKRNDEREHYAKIWSQAEGDIGLERLKNVLEYFRMIVLRERPKHSLITDFERTIYQEGSGVQRGSDVMQQLKAYLDIYRDFYYEPSDFFKENMPDLVGYLNVMKNGLAEEEWLPAVLFWYKKFGRDSIFPFIQLLDKKLTSDWISGVSRYFRSQFTFNLIKGIHDFDHPLDILNDRQLFEVNTSQLEHMLRQDMYGKLYTKYLLLKTEYLMKSTRILFNPPQSVTIDHILPQNPYEWTTVFTEDEHRYWLHKLGNLLLINRKEDYILRGKSLEEKKQRYYVGSEDMFPSVQKIMYRTVWTADTISERQEEIINLLMRHFTN